MAIGTRAGLVAGIAALVVGGLTSAASGNDTAPLPGLDELTPQAVGSYLDDTGALVLTVTDTATADAIRRAGGTVRIVRHTLEELTGVQHELDELGRTGRAGKARTWYVDPVSDTVVVKVPPGANDPATRRFLATARSHSTMVSVRPAYGRLTTTGTDLKGGDEVDLSNGYLCSVGFPAISSAGTPIFFTAGHCTQGRPGFTSNGDRLGTTRVSRYPGDDWGSVNVTGRSWVLRGRVDRFGGSDVRVRGWSNAPVGTTVCKSGRTTHWTCGKITARNVSVNYGDGFVTGLFAHSACVEEGDSGGPVMAGNLAQGLISGAANLNGQCMEKYGQPNDSLAQPIGEALAVSRASLVLG